MSLLDRAYLLFTGQAAHGDVRLALVLVSLVGITSAVLCIIHAAYPDRD